MVTGKLLNLSEALEWGHQCLEKQGIGNSRRESQILLGHVLNKTTDYLYTHAESLIPEDSLGSFRNLIEQRCEHIPWQHLTGRAEFISWDFLVNDKVLIPRPETEILVETAIKKVKSLSQKESNSYVYNIIDAGTGCGNIAISLAKTLSCQVYALDISEVALRVARHNAQRLGAEDKITFLKEDILSLDKESLLPGSLRKKIDLLISNPPYVTSGELNQLAPEVSIREPKTALDGGKEGLNFYPPLIAAADIFLIPGGYLALEIGINQAKAVSKMIRKNNRFAHPEIVKDYAGIDRIIMAQKR